MTGTRSLPCTVLTVTTITGQMPMAIKASGGHARAIQTKLSAFRLDRRICSALRRIRFGFWKV